jgi:hypothetical protein
MSLLFRTQFDAMTPLLARALLVTSLMEKLMRMRVRGDVGFHGWDD